MIDNRASKQHAEMLCCFLPAFRESTSLKELDMEFPRGNGPSNLAFENMLTHTLSLRSLRLGMHARNIDVATARSGLKKNTTLRELTLESEKDISPVLTSLRDHPVLRRLCLRGPGAVDLTELETVLLSDTSKIAELEIDRICWTMFHSPPLGLTPVLRALARRPTLTKLRVCCCPLDRDEARLLQMALHKTPS
jgi:hypothetical protein